MSAITKLNEMFPVVFFMYKILVALVHQNGNGLLQVFAFSKIGM